MPRIAYVDGRYVPHAEACVHVEDRGLQFADSVYEVWGVRAGRLMDEEAHFDRLDRSLGELEIRSPAPRGALRVIIHEIARRNRIAHGLVYLQVTRGAAPRDHAFPGLAVRPTVIVTAKRIDPDVLAKRAQDGVSVRTAPDIRWGRRDIKTTGLLANVLAKQAALDAGVYEAWLVDADGLVTEGTATNAWIVDAKGVLRTRPASNDILNGVTRRAVMAIAKAQDVAFEERAFSVEEAKAAKEAFLTSATSAVTPVVAIDGAPVGDGKPGSLARALRAGYLDGPAG